VLPNVIRSTVRWGAGHAACMGRCREMQWGRLKEKGKWEDKIILYLKEAVWVGVHWNCLARDGD